MLGYATPKNSNSELCYQILGGNGSRVPRGMEHDDDSLSGTAGH
jgi:hypothetical protein